MQFETFCGFFSRSWFKKTGFHYIRKFSDFEIGRLKFNYLFMKLLSYSEMKWKLNFLSNCCSDSYSVYAIYLCLKKTSSSLLNWTKEVCYCRSDHHRLKAKSRKVYFLKYEFWGVNYIVAFKKGYCLVYSQTMTCKLPIHSYFVLCNYLKAIWKAWKRRITSPNPTSFRRQACQLEPNCFIQGGSKIEISSTVKFCRR